MNGEILAKPRPALGWRILFFAIPGLALVLLAVGGLIQKMRSDESCVRVGIQERLAALRAAGQPLTAQDLAKIYPDPPAEHDARPMLNRGLSALVLPEESTNLPFFSGMALPRRAPLDESVMAEAQQWLSKNSAALASIPWDELGGAWIGSGFTNGLDKITRSPAITPLIWLLCLDAIVKAEQQRPRDAVESLQRALAVGNTFRNDLLIHTGLRAFAQRTVCQALERLLNPITKEADPTCLAHGLTLTNVGAVREIWSFQLCWGIFVADTLQAQATQMVRGARSPGTRLLRAYQAQLFYRDDDLLDYLEWNARCQAALGMPISNAIPALAAIDRELDDPKNQRVSFLNPFRKHRFTVLSVHKLRLKDFFTREVECVAGIRAALAAMAIERWRLAHGNRLPESLVELVPLYIESLPMDPFNEQPLRYKKLARGYVVYSIGPDFNDDGGKEKNADSSDSAHYDITFTVER